MLFTALTVVTGVLLYPGVAMAHHADGGGEAFGFVQNPYLTGSFHVEQHSANPWDASGYVRGRPTAPVLGDLRRANGPARCVQIRGNKVGILYSGDASSRPAVERRFELLVTAVDNGAGSKDTVGLLEGPPGTFQGCEPSLAPQPLTDGDVTVRSRR